MPAIQNTVLTDRAGTPVNHTFVPQNVVQGIGTVVESTGVPVGNSRLSVSLRKTETGRFKSTVQLAVPVLVTEVINGVSQPKVVRTAYANATFTFDETSSLQERKDLVGMFQSSLDPSKLLVNDTVIGLQGVYG